MVPHLNEHFVSKQERYGIKQIVAKATGAISYDRLEKVCTFTIYGKMMLLVTIDDFD